MHWAGAQGRGKHTIEEKRRIVEETHVRGASVATVARRHDVNAEPGVHLAAAVSAGIAGSEGSGRAAQMLPVKVSTPTVMPTERALVQVPSRPSAQRALSQRIIEIKLPNGHSIVLHGPGGYESALRA